MRFISFRRPHGCGRTLSFGGVDFATRIAAPPGEGELELDHERSDDAQIVCENLRNLWLIPVLIALVAQLDRALASGAKGCGFDPRRAHGLDAWKHRLLVCLSGRNDNANRPTDSELLATFDGYGVNCPLQFFATNTHDVQRARFSRPTSIVIKFDPATRQTTSRERRYPNPVFPFFCGSWWLRCRCFRQIKIQSRQLTC